MDGFTHRRLLQMVWSCEVGFGKEMVICVLPVVEQLTKLTLNHLLGQIGPVST